jgi:Cu/Ag efflux protein CusF
MRPRLTTVIAVAALALAAAIGSVSSASAATVRHFEGRVVSVDRSAKSFKLRDSERGAVNVFVVGSTRFSRTSFAAVKTGRGIEVTVRRVDGRWQATKVEPRTGARHAEPGDDHGGGRGGNDDGANHR